MTSTALEYDVLIASDLRFPGGTSHSIAEEVTAQARAGLRTGLIHLNGPLVRGLHPVNPKLRRAIESGEADLLVGQRRVRARVLVIRHPAVAQHALAQLPPLEVEQVIVVANAGPVDARGTVIYDVATVTREVTERLGHVPKWTGIGPAVRKEIAPAVDPVQLLDDWVNIIDVDAWAVERPEWTADRPVIGRHSRPHPQKWPRDVTTLRLAYPTDGSVTVRVLGGAEPAEDLLGTLPSSWTVLPFGAVGPREFLAGLDFFVYFHDPGLVEAFGRTILEAIASGAVAILPPHFEELFGPSAVYTTPDGVAATVAAFRADRARYDAQVETARQEIRARFGHEQHASRIRALLGQDATPDLAAQEPPAARDAATLLGRNARPKVLLMSSNGAGMGHLTRLLAYARAMGDDAEIRFLSLSQAVPLVGQFGFDFEYVASSQGLAMPPGLWQDVYVTRVSDAIGRFRPDVVVFDGTWPYNGTPDIRAQHPQARWIWSRRGMWRADANGEQLAKTGWFDEVLEPGDLAAPYDRGAARNEPAHRVGPVTLLDPADLDPRAEARSALGLPADGPLALLSLGAGNINDTSGDIGAATAALGSLGVGVCLTQTAIASTPVSTAQVHLVKDYPLSRRYAAFDVVVSATGYNSFHELMRMGVPSLLVPNTATALDDTEARARYAADQGWAFSVDKVTVDGATPLLEKLLTDGPQMVAGAQAADPGNGAVEAARLILSLAERTSR
ncbi:glycosyltransferase [Nocardioides sp. AE5]|uniref:glycosyltransferase n=1 Tax=Nocardioides sp. AE5 TaxID=2962573 RepID=UPI002881BA25|nr:glycosyltransferase [Nocardioides sp. AE5]MDT0202925.1 glycosyltransferase [Nocardioides sp. AE5]